MSAALFGLAGAGLIAWFAVGEWVGSLFESRFGKSHSFGIGVWLFATFLSIGVLGLVFGA